MNDNIPAGYDENGVRGGNGQWQDDDYEVTEKYLRNEFLVIRIDNDLSMCGKDLTDLNNEPTTITISKRRLKQAVEAIKKAFNEEMKLGDFEDILEKCNIRMHSYCAVD